MMLLRYLPLLGGSVMIAAAIAVLGRDFYRLRRCRQSELIARRKHRAAPWHITLALALLAWGSMVLSLGIVIFPS